MKLGEVHQYTLFSAHASFDLNHSQWGTYLWCDVTCLFINRTGKNNWTTCSDSILLESLSCYSVLLVQHIFRRARVDLWWEEKRKNIARVADILKEDQWSLCKLIAEWTGIPKTIVQQILHEDFQKWKLCTWFVPRALTTEQKEQRLTTAP